MGYNRKKQQQKGIFKARGMCDESLVWQNYFTRYLGRLMNHVIVHLPVEGCHLKTANFTVSYLRLLGLDDVFKLST